MSTSTNYTDRLEHELLGAIGRRRRKRTMVTRLTAMTAVMTAGVGAFLLTGSESSPALAVDIDITGQPSERSDVVMFAVSSPTPSYWRVIALGDFDGTEWTPSPGETSDVSDPLPQGCEAGAQGDTVTQTFEIRGLGGNLLPASFAPVRVDGPEDITLDAETSSLSTATKISADLRYSVESVLADYPADCLRAANASPPTSIADRYLALPADFPAELADQARAITGGAATPYDRAIALQNWFKDFTYDRAFRASESDTAIQEFLAQRRGYCEQFAGTYAAFARVVGLPSRVAVGFLPGELREDGRYYVLGDDAHAWVEIYFEGVGWVAFDPTPGRGQD